MYIYCTELEVKARGDLMGGMFVNTAPGVFGQLCNGDVPNGLKGVKAKENKVKKQKK